MTSLRMLFNKKLKDVVVNLAIGASVPVLTHILFEGSEGVVTKIDYRKERARVDFRFEGNDCHVWIAVDSIQTMKMEQE